MSHSTNHIQLTKKYRPNRTMRTACLGNPCFIRPPGCFASVIFSACAGSPFASVSPVRPSLARCPLAWSWPVGFPFASCPFIGVPFARCPFAGFCCATIRACRCLKVSWAICLWNSTQRTGNAVTRMQQKIVCAAGGMSARIRGHGDRRCGDKGFR